MGKLYTCAELADYYNVPIGTVWYWIRKGKLAAIRIGKEYRVSENEIRKFEDANNTKTKENAE